MTQPEAESLQTLKVRQAKLNRKLDDINQNLVLLNNQKCKIKHTLVNIENSLAKLKVNRITISDHAIVRYLERVKEMDIESIRKEILDEASEKQALVLGDCVIPNKTGKFKLQIKSGNVLTIKL